MYVRNVSAGDSNQPGGGELHRGTREEEASRLLADGGKAQAAVQAPVQVGHGSAGVTGSNR